MNIADVTRGERAFTLTWDDQSAAELPYIWLRDNDPDELHPHTRERVFDLTSVPLDISPASHALDDRALVVTWPGKDSPSVYASDWLYRHQPGRSRPDDSRVQRTLWDRDELGDIPRYDASECARDVNTLKRALLTLKKVGLVAITGLDETPSAGESFADLIGFKRQTNFGTTFEVLSKPQPNNLAYTSMALPLHTDLPNQEVVPGYQFLHSYRNSASGGDSVFADGFRICADLRESAPDDFAVLNRAQVPWRFHDDSCDIRAHRPIISLRENGEFDCFVFNAHIADVPDIPASQLHVYYRAYRRLMVQMREARYSVQRSLAPGEMIVFDNARVLHGRTAFDPESGDRHFRGYYIERNEVDSCIRMLAR